MNFSIKVDKTSLDGVKLISPSTNFEDFRGSYVELYNKELFSSAGINLDFIQDDISVSRKNVLRGIHGDAQTWKLVSCLRGTFYMIVVNNDKSSPEYKKWEAFTLSDVNRKLVLIPPNFGNGHLVMSEESIFHYKQTTIYNRSSQFTIKWNDPKFNFWWPIKNPITSVRDEGI